MGLFTNSVIYKNGNEIKPFIALIFLKNAVCKQAHLYQLTTTAERTRDWCFFYDPKSFPRLMLLCRANSMVQTDNRVFDKQQNRRVCVLFEKYLSEIKTEAPKEFVLKYLSGSFSKTVKWLLSEKSKYQPAEIAEYIISFIPIRRI